MWTACSEKLQEWMQNPRQRMAVLGLVLIFLLVGGYQLFATWSGPSSAAPVYVPRDLPAPIAAAFQWVKEKKLAPGSYPGLALPEAHRQASCDGKARVVVSATGRVVMLVKTRIGSSGSYEAVVCASEPVADLEIRQIELIGDYLAIKGLHTANGFPLIVYQTTRQFFDVTGTD